MGETDTIKQRMEVLEKEIRETRKRLPAHSVKPPVMMELLALEDEYDELLARMNRLKQDTE